MRKGYVQAPNHVAKRMASKHLTLLTRPKPFEKQWLEEKYIGAGLDCVQIGAIASRDPKTIWSWLRHYGIPTRPRGSNHIHLPKDGRSFRGKRHTQKTKDFIRDARKRDGHVPYLKDGKHWLQHDGAVHPNWKGGVTPERQAFYSTEEWREACCAVWARADAQCERCGIHHNTTKSRGTFHVHHIVSFMVKGLRAEVGNLALLCKTCHLFVHSNKNKLKEFIKEK